MEREVLIVGYDGATLLDVAGPVDVFDGAGQVCGGYRVRLAGLGGGFAVTAGLRMRAEDLREVTGPVDTLVVVGGQGFTRAAADAELLAHLTRLAATARRVASVCTGALVLAAAGLLEGCRATTHWAYCAELAAHPGVEVVPDAIFVQDGRTATSAGVSAGIDLALALVEQDHGAALARLLARWLVVFLQRPGGQSQFSVRSRVPPVREAGLRAVLDAVVEDPTGPWTVERMARRAAMSTRHFARVFPRRVGLSPARYVERVRVEAAATALESGDDGLDVVARNCGFGTAETLRRAFSRVLGVTPGGYRHRFRTTGAA
ncbi:GlxA family transcriptional regulator [Saccharothrix coeruleofusca]|uniref:AraC family transcriptional regulator n=1 Tax=Saccharothrix coeruleofusca TaxID=33919 RepID=A0A918ATY7_9PSEU|nr:DJ-1/PfpI family protein [Saccharothrix coeruleofusca]MBP2336960.1 transcriptional regulator GlxA family with amidase domain [Saccharothrix coeruleofusca]GGP84204.1 AraC family transcriptional regulator [Saccharothrix coeruleofusca]